MNSEFSDMNIINKINLYLFAVGVLALGLTYSPDDQSLNLLFYSIVIRDYGVTELNYDMNRRKPHITWLYCTFSLFTFCFDSGILISRCWCAYIRRCTRPLFVSCTRKYQQISFSIANFQNDSAVRSVGGVRRLLLLAATQIDLFGIEDERTEWISHHWQCIQIFESESWVQIHSPCSFARCDNWSLTVSQVFSMCSANITHSMVDWVNFGWQIVCSCISMIQRMSKSFWTIRIRWIRATRTILLRKLLDTVSLLWKVNEVSLSLHLSVANHRVFAISIVAEGWRFHRKHLNPCFSPNIINSFYPIFNKGMQLFVKKLKVHANKEPFNIIDDIRSCAMDLICGEKNLFSFEFHFSYNFTNWLSRATYTT